MKINLNKEEYLHIKSLECGKTQNIEIKMGRNTYYCDVDKDCASAYVHFFKKTTKLRQNQSKYDPSSEMHSVFVKTDAILDKRFFKKIAEIENAQDICREYKSVLHM